MNAIQRLGDTIMNMTHWNSQSNLDDFFSGLNRAMTARPAQESVATADWIPAIDVTENNDAFMIKAELPEVKKTDVKVSIDKNILTISGERTEQVKDEKQHRIERSYGRFSRSFSLPENIDGDNVRAESKNGMLYLTIPKAVEKQQLKQIKIH